MKKALELLIVFLIPLLGICQNSKAQTNIDNLRNLKASLAVQMKVLQDSILKINQEILKADKDLSTQVDGSQKKQSIFVEINVPHAMLYSEANVQSYIIDSIPKSNKVEILEIGGLFDSYLKTEYGKNIGYIVMSDIITTVQFNKFRDAIKSLKQEEEAKKEKERASVENTKHFIELGKKYGFENAAKILDGKIWIGMSKDMAYESIGVPIKVNRSVTQNSIREQWVYNKRYLYFEGNILKSWQDSF